MRTKHSLALLTDLYELTMARAYWKAGVAEDEAVFTLSFRSNPFRGGFTVACGLAQAVEFLLNERFTGSDVEYLATLRGNDDRPLFDPAFLDMLMAQEFRCDVHAIPEGTVVFPGEPLLRVQGPILQAQIVESAMLNVINFQSLIATKAARICIAAGEKPVVEFGLRRAQGIDGGLSASRAAFIGGCAATSNALAGKRHGIPVSGTQAHSWIMFFDRETEAFDTYAEALPNNCIFLVDTFDSLEGVRHAIATGRRMRTRGHEMIGIRLDSGDLAALSIEARKLLDEAGFNHARIVASGDLDEHAIARLNAHGAKVDVWGVGTRLVTGYDEPALGGIYKLTAVRRPGEAWRYKIKLSDVPEKTSTPGIQQARRFFSASGAFVEDLIYDVESGTADEREPFEDLLAPVLLGGRLASPMPSLETIRARTAAQLARLDPAVKRFDGAASFPVRLDARLARIKSDLIAAARKGTP